jgi:hypothetical protein
MVVGASSTVPVGPRRVLHRIEPRIVMKLRVVLNTVSQRCPDLLASIRGLRRCAVEIPNLYEYFFEELDRS